MLLLVAALTCLNTLGLPGFIRRPLQAELRARGLDLRFTKLHLSGYRVVLAEKVQLGRADDPLHPHLTIDAMELRFDRHALRRFQLKPAALFVRQGRLVWPLPPTNEPPEQLVLDHISAELRLRPDDQWHLAQFSADTLGIRLHLVATLTNASRLASWNWRRATGEPSVGQARLRQVVRAIERIKFGGSPALRVMASGDAAEPDQFAAEVVFTAPQCASPWGEAARTSFNGTVAPPTAPGAARRVTTRLTLESPRTRWAHAQHAEIESRFHFLAPADLLDAEWTATIQALEARGAKAERCQLTGRTGKAAADPNEWQTQLSLSGWQLEHPVISLRDAHLEGTVSHWLTNWQQFRAEGVLTGRGLASRWADAGQVLLNARVASVARHAPLQADTSWAWWAGLEPFSAAWECRVSEFRAPELPIEEVFCAGRWRAPEVTLSDLQARLRGGQLRAQAALNVATRGARATGTLDFDLKALMPLLTENTRRFLAQYAWATPPQIAAEASLTLPAWTNTTPDWRAEVLPALHLKGEVKAPGGGAFRGVWVDFAHSQFTLSNAVWHLPDLVVHRPDGRAELSYTGDLRTRDFAFRVRSQLDPSVLQPALDEQTERALGWFQFTTPPAIEGDIRGRWSVPELIGFTARLAATNFTFRGETCGVFTAAVEFTNRFLRASDVRIRREEGELHVPALGFDLPSHALWFTNATSTIEPAALLRAIGPKTARALSPYRFHRPPTARVNGRIPTRGEDADARFEIRGGPFSYWRFSVPEIAGHVHWSRNALAITNLAATFYNGQLRGELFLDDLEGPGDRFRFRANVAGADLAAFMTDVVSRTNRSKGLVNCNLTITSAKTDDWKSWQGFGDISLRDGQLWDVPLFGYFSHLLNVFYPGLGSTRASSGRATFTLRDSVITSDDLVIHEPSARLKYRGHVDFDGNVNARVEAELLRDTWLLGRLFSLALWPVTKLFEYNVTGTLAKPKTEPKYFLSRFLLLPLHPLRTLEELLPDKSGDDEKLKSSGTPP